MEKTTKESERVNQVDKEFNRVINVEVRTDITKAFLMLDTNLKEGLMSAKSEEERKKILLKKASQCKDMLNEYIDLLVRTALKANFEEDVQ